MKTNSPRNLKQKTGSGSGGGGVVRDPTHINYKTVQIPNKN